ncbi:MAG: hypothetical protein VKJ86_03985 [Synechococcus sp.]|nr:hypothetical protein [Synechococcus sp.]
MDKYHLVTTPFPPQQIVCLGSGDRRLYGAVIQYIKTQGTYWLRPLCLVTTSPQGKLPISLHCTADIIISAQQVREAFDTEILDFWSFLYDDSGDYQENSAGRCLLQNFLRELTWPEKKSAS